MLSSTRRAQPESTTTALSRFIAANIAIGRDWAGGQYYFDYYESFRLGEQVALGVLEEQKLQCSESFAMSVPLLDGTAARI